jgi:hypothetical protein
MPDNIGLRADCQELFLRWPKTSDGVGAASFGRSKAGGVGAAPMIEYFLPVSRSRTIMAIRCLKSATDSGCGYFVFVSMPDNTPIKADCQVVDKDF